MTSFDAPQTPLTPTGHQRTTGGNFRWEPPTPEELQALMPGYTIEKLLGRGGMGAVYKGVQQNLDRTVAIKVLPPGVEMEDPSFAERFKNEAKLMAKLLHPAVVAVFDFGTTSGGQLYIAMEYVDGSDVSQMIRSQGKLPPEHALAITAHVCDALAAAHELGIVHRDIKPANVLINMKGQVKVADFGLAKVEEPGTHGLTKTGYAMGTPDFVAPEVLMLGANIDGRADLYAVGVMLYQMLTGEVPRGAFKPATARIPGLDRRYDPIILKAMQSDREERYQSSAELRRDLDVILTVPFVLQDEPPTSAIPAAQVAQTPAQRSAAQKPLARSAGAPTRQPAVNAGEGSRAPFPPKKSSAPLLLGLSAAAAVGIGAFVMFSGGKKPEGRAAAPPAAVIAPIHVSTAPAPKPAGGGTSVVATPPSNAQPQWQKAEWTNQELQGSKTTRSGGGLRIPPSASLHLPASMAQGIDYAVRGKTKFSKDLLPPKWTITLQDRTSVWFMAVNGGSLYITAPKDRKVVSQTISPSVAEDEEIVVEHAVIGSRQLFRINRRQFGSAEAPVPAYRRSYVFQALPQSEAWLKDIEYVNLDGVANPEAFLGWNVPMSGAKIGSVPVATSSVVTSATSPPAIAAAPAPPPASPAPSAPVSPSPSLVGATSALDQRLAAIESSFQAAVERDANTAFKASMAALDKLYLTALDRTLAAASKGGKLEEALALREEKQRIEKGEGVPSEVDESTLAPGKVPETIKTLRQTYRSTTAQHEATKAKAMQPLYDKYDQALAAVQTELTQSQKLDDALRVKALREKIAVTRGGAVEAGASIPASKGTVSATKEKPFINSLEMEFVPVPGTSILMCIHETRRKDYSQYDSEVRGVETSWKAPEVEGKRLQGQKPSHPVINVSWEDATAFCEWLSKKERRTYRLPTEHEWNLAVVTDLKDPESISPGDLRAMLGSQSPWGSEVDVKCGNYNGNGDGYDELAPVMSLRSNHLGIYDLGGNAWEWCSDWFDSNQTERVLRGCGYRNFGGYRISGTRESTAANFRVAPAGDFVRRVPGFRCVLEVGKAVSPTAATKPATPTPTPPVSPAPAPAAALKDGFINSLGMKFVPVKDTDVLFCIHETRRQDYAAYAAEVPGVNGAWKDQQERGVPVGDKDDHPAVSICWDDAQAFCAWLSKKEGRLYRLPTDREWSIAVGIAREEKWKADTTPFTVFRVPGEYPWGGKWPPPKGAGNYCDLSYQEAINPMAGPPNCFLEYNDGFATTAPVMSFKPNRYGLYDLGGNVWEWVEDWFDPVEAKRRTTRGSCWAGTSGLPFVTSSVRGAGTPDNRWSGHGFRIVLVPSGPAPATAAPMLPR